MFEKNSHVIITGASRGVGRAIARAFHKAGARVSLVARTERDLKKLADELGERCAWFAADLRKPREIDACLQHFRKQFGPVDVLVNNAGVGAYKPFAETSEAELIETLEIGLTSVVLMTRAVSKGNDGAQAGTDYSHRLRSRTQTARKDVRVCCGKTRRGGVLAIAGAGTKRIWCQIYGAHARNH